MANVAAKTTYTQTTVSAAGTPSTSSKFDLAVMAPLIREIVAKGIVEEPKLAKDLTSARSFFKGNDIIKANTILADLPFGQEVRVDIEKDQNPLGLFQSTSINYSSVDSCHDQISLDCEVPCINTLPTFQHIVFRFDKEYAYGVRACDKNKDFYDLNFFTKQYALSREGEQFGRELDLWNTVIKGVIAAPATTVDVKLAAAHPTQYWSNLGALATYGRKTISEAYWYMVNNYQNVDPTIFMAAEAAQELISSVETFAPYSVNFTNTRINTFEQWDVPGFMVASQVRELIGLPANATVVVMKRSPWLTTASTTSGGTTFASQYPLWNATATKQYVAILDPRVGYQIAKDGYHLVINPYDCNKLVRGMIDTEYVGSGITFPQFGMVLEYNMTTLA